MPAADEGDNTTAHSHRNAHYLQWFEFFASVSMNMQVRVIDTRLYLEHLSGFIPSVSIPSDFCQVAIQNFLPSQ